MSQATAALLLRALWLDARHRGGYYRPETSPPSAVCVMPRSTVHPIVQIDKSIFHFGFILLPLHAIRILFRPQLWRVSAGYHWCGGWPLCLALPRLHGAPR